MEIGLKDVMEGAVWVIFGIIGFVLLRRFRRSDSGKGRIFLIIGWIILIFAVVGLIYFIAHGGAGAINYPS